MEFKTTQNSNPFRRLGLLILVTWYFGFLKHIKNGEMSFSNNQLKVQLNPLSNHNTWHHDHLENYPDLSQNALYTVLHTGYKPAL